MQSSGSRSSRYVNDTMNKTQNLPFVSVVVIGRNEEKHLEACFRSIFNMNYPHNKLEIIYVDTDSRDKSVDIAKQFNVKIAEEQSDFPSPGLARNRGIREAQYEIIHFIDGDMTVDRNYLKNAIPTLQKNNIACVIGDISERYSDRSFLAKVLNYPWRKRKKGIVDAPGAGGTFLKSILQEIGGYNPLILKGQETELGFRIRQKGYQIYKIENKMGTHDYGINNIHSLMKHSYTMGKSYGKILTLPPQQSYFDFINHARNLLIQGIILFTVILCLLLTKKVLFVLLIPVVLSLYVTIRHMKEYYSHRDWYAPIYYIIMHLSKPIVLYGLLEYLCTHFIRMLSQRFVKR